MIFSYYGILPVLIIEHAAAIFGRGGVNRGTVLLSIVIGDLSTYPEMTSMWHGLVINLRFTNRTIIPPHKSDRSDQKVN